MKWFVKLVLPLVFLNLTLANEQPKNNPTWQGAKSEIKHFESFFSQPRRGLGNIQSRMQFYQVPGLSIATLKNGRLDWAKAYGTKQAGFQDTINLNTLFSFGSISKVVTATTALKVVSNKSMELDKDINRYLTSWKVPQNEFTQKQPVSLRHILSHTAGFNVSGFEDFQPNETLPSTLDIVLGRQPAKNSPIKLLSIPGSKMGYSGGGTTILQLALEDTLKKPFAKIVQSKIFEPLRMNRSFFALPSGSVKLNIAKAHDSSGRPTALPRGWESMPEQAASGLWSTPVDLLKLMSSLIKSHQGANNSILPQYIAIEMMTPVTPSYFGLGVGLIDKSVFFHSGSNDSYKSLMKADLITGDGFIIATNGANGSRLVHEIAVAFDDLNTLKGS
jgi:CubicO group peptidase (beta-lactamase class C family)